MRSSTSPSHFLVLAVVAGFALIAGACSTPSQTPDPTSSTTTSSSPSGPSLSFLYTTPDNGLVLHKARTDTTRTIASDVAYDSVRALSSSRRYLAFSYTSADSSHLALWDIRTETMQTVDARSASATYSLAWHPSEERFAFAYYEPARSGTRGPGDVFVATTDGTTRDVGCSAAREVLHWLPDGSLATRNDDRLYVVNPADCATRASADARRMHHATYAPSGEHLAYIHRELTYDRDRGEYTPDSSLFLSDARGNAPEELFGYDRRVRHLRWAEDGTELAFDVRVEASNHRQIAVYNVGSERTVYLTPPDQTTTDQQYPRWSPSGTHVAFTTRSTSGRHAAVRVDGQTRRVGPVDGAVWGWVDNQTLVVPGPDSLRIQSLKGQTRYSHPAPAALLHAWSRDPA